MQRGARRRQARCSAGEQRACRRGRVGAGARGAQQLAAPTGGVHAAGEGAGQRVLEGGHSLQRVHKIVHHLQGRKEGSTQQAALSAGRAVLRAGREEACCSLQRAHKVMHRLQGMPGGQQARSRHFVRGAGTQQREGFAPAQASARSPDAQPANREPRLHGNSMASQLHARPTRQGRMHPCACRQGSENQGAVPAGQQGGQHRQGGECRTCSGSDAIKRRWWVEPSGRRMRSWVVPGVPAAGSGPCRHEPGNGVRGGCVVGWEVPAGLPASTERTLAAGQLIV